jgi:hypothetical protein
MKREKKENFSTLSTGQFQRINQGQVPEERVRAGNHRVVLHQSWTSSTAQEQTRTK